MSELELIIELFIQENGGAIKLADRIEHEWRRNMSNRIVKRWSYEEDLFVLKHQDTMNYEKIANILGRPVQGTYYHIALLRKRAMAEFRNSR